MSPIDVARHLLSFLAPAVGVSLLLAIAGKVVLPRNGPPWWKAFLVNFLAGAAVLVAGLWVFGRDGKMVTYAALVVVVATCQWLTARAWRP